MIQGGARSPHRAHEIWRGPYLILALFFLSPIVAKDEERLRQAEKAIVADESPGRQARRNIT
jgi:hypothetical protein